MTAILAFAFLLSPAQGLRHNAQAWLGDVDGDGKRGTLLDYRACQIMWGRTDWTCIDARALEGPRVTYTIDRVTVRDVSGNALKRATIGRARCRRRASVDSAYEWNLCYPADLTVSLTITTRVLIAPGADFVGLYEMWVGGR